MSKKVIIFVCFFVAVTALLAYFAMQATNKIGQEVSPTPQAKKTSEKTATVYFSPALVTKTQGASSSPLSADLFVDTGDTPITGVQVELTYDPAILSNVSLQIPTDETAFFKNEYQVLFQNVYQNTGRISYALGINPGSSSKVGIGKIGKVTFSANGTGQTTINFLQKTMVTREGETESILKQTIPVVINL